MIMMVKKLLLITVVALQVLSIRAQYSFYIDPQSPGRELMENKLSGASQFIAGSRTTADYTIKTDISSDKGAAMTVKIFLMDSTNFTTIFQQETTFTLSGKKDQYEMLTTNAYSFFEKNMKQIIISSRQHTFFKLHKLLKERKDKT